jgi:hypothetical protein
MDVGMKEAAVVGRKRGISGSTLKIIAVVSMFIDHVGAAVLGKILNGWRQLARTWFLFDRYPGICDWDKVYAVYIVMRYIGRIAFPIYCFLLVEGFERTHNLKKYALRLFGFALVSEIPFDLCFKAQVLEFSYQNIFFTLFIALLSMTGSRWGELRHWTENVHLNKVFGCLSCVVCTVAGMAAAELLSTDYGGTGVLCIMVLYVFRKKKIPQAIAGAIAFLWEVTAPLAFLPILAYNGTRGLKLKYFFYAFYPVHLLIIYILCVIMGLGNIPAF